MNETLRTSSSNPNPKFKGRGRGRLIHSIRTLEELRDVAFDIVTETRRDPLYFRVWVNRRDALPGKWRFEEHSLEHKDFREFIGFLVNSEVEVTVSSQISVTEGIDVFGLRVIPPDNTLIWRDLDDFYNSEMA